MTDVTDASNYLLTVNQLSQQTSTTRQPPAIPSEQNLLSSFPYLPFVLSGVLFISALFIQLMGKIRTARQIITALSIALFAASIPAALPYLQTGVREVSHASPQTQPKNLSVAQADSSTVQIHWITDVETLGGLRIWKSSSDRSRAKLYFSNNRQPTTLHITSVPNLISGQQYEFEILSDAQWYTSEATQMTFTFQ